MINIETIPRARPGKNNKTVIISLYAHSVLDKVRANKGLRSYKATLESLIIDYYNEKILPVERTQE